MRMLMAIVFGCALLIGVNHDASSRPTAHAAPQACSMDEAGFDDALDEGLGDASNYICPISPLCQKASQCTAYCAGGIPVCFQGCCSCAS